MNVRPYSERQLDIINGIIDIESVSGQEVSKLLKKAIAFNDEDVIAMAKKQYDINKQKARKRLNERNNRAYHERKENGFTWKPPRSENYTERQKKIINNEIALDSVLTRELIDIAQKAELKQDFVLAESMLSLVHDRKAEYAERNRQRARAARSKENFGNERSVRQKYALTKFDLNVLEGYIDLRDCTLTYLYDIKKICIKRSDEKNLKIVEQLIRYKEDPNSILITTDHNEALAMIEKMMTSPILQLNQKDKE